MPRAAVATAFGGPENVSVVDVDIPAPGPGQVRVAVRAAAVNPIDWKVYSGMMGADPASLPKRLGNEAAGVVVAVGEGAEGPRGPFAVGDEVVAYSAPGAYADEVVVAGSALVPKPASLSFEQAAGLMLAGTTAVHVIEAAGVGPGDTVLVHGAAGGVGLFVLQLAVARGARVIGTASPRNHDAVTRFGAEPVAYGDGLADRVRAMAPDGVDAALDLVGSDEAVDTSLELVPDRGRVASIAAFRRGDTGIKLLGGGPGADPGTEIRDRARLQLVDLADAGKLQVVVARTYPLTDAAEAHRAGQAGGQPPGKVVLVP